MKFVDKYARRWDKLGYVEVDNLSDGITAVVRFIKPKILKALWVLTKLSSVLKVPVIFAILQYVHNK